MNHRFRQSLILFGFLCFLGRAATLASAQSGVYTPASGSDERKAIMDALRAPVERELKQQVVFVVTTLRVENGWAYLKSTPQGANGRPIDLSSQVGSGSDGSITALLHRISGRWRIVTHALGSARAASGWSNAYHAPRAIFDSGSVSPSNRSPSGSVYTPKAGSAERKALMDALRIPVEKDLKQSVVFNVKTLHAQNGWAFLYGIPVRPGGKPIDYRRTPYQQAIDAGAFGSDVAALFHRVNGRWRVVRYVLGPTDVAWETWDRDYHAPSAIFKLN